MRTRLALRLDAGRSQRPIPKKCAGALVACKRPGRFTHSSDGNAGGWFVPFELSAAMTFFSMFWIVFAASLTQRISGFSYFIFFTSFLRGYSQLESRASGAAVSIPVHRGK